MSDAKSTIDPARREFLWRFHRPVQKAALYFVGPISVVVFGVTAFKDPCWQNSVRFAAMFGMTLAWVWAHQYAKRNDLEKSVIIGLGAIFGCQTIEIHMVEGTEAATLLAFLATLCYASMFSKRYLWTSGAVTLLAIVASEVVKFLDPYDVKLVTGIDRLVNQVLFVTVLLWMAVYVLSKAQSISDTLYEEQRKRNEEQKKIIDTANRIQAVIDNVMPRFYEMSTGFASQAAEQAASTAEVQTTMGRIKEIVDDTATSASSTRMGQEQFKTSSLEVRRQLIEVQSGFAELTDRFKEASHAITNLTASAANIKACFKEFRYRYDNK